jgi:hypothetical protein
MKKEEIHLRIFLLENMDAWQHAGDEKHLAHMQE